MAFTEANLARQQNTAENWANKRRIDQDMWQNLSDNIYRLAQFKKAGDEAEAGRAFEAGESQLGREFEGENREDVQKWQAWQNELDRMAALERAKLGIKGKSDTEKEDPFYAAINKTIELAYQEGWDVENEMYAFNKIDDVEGFVEFWKDVYARELSNDYSPQEVQNILARDEKILRKLFNEAIMAKLVRDSIRVPHPVFLNDETVSKKPMPKDSMNMNISPLEPSQKVMGFRERQQAMTGLPQESFDKAEAEFRKLRQKTREAWDIGSNKPGVEQEEKAQYNELINALYSLRRMVPTNTEIEQGLLQKIKYLMNAKATLEQPGIANLDVMSIINANK